MNRVAAALAACLALTLAAPASAEEAKDLFKQKCAACHGPDGKGQTSMGKRLGAKDLTQDKDGLAEIVKRIEEGKPPKMLPYKGKLSPEQIQSLAAYVKGGLK